MTAGPLVLIGSGEFTAAMSDVDRELLAPFGSHPRVAVVPTAAGLEDTAPIWAERGREHFRALGAEPVAIMVLNKDDAHEPKWREEITNVDLIYFSGGDPGHIVSTLDGSPFWYAVLERHNGGAVLAGSSAGAMMLGESTFVPTARGPDGFPTKMTVRHALGLVPGVIVAPHFDILPKRLVEMWASLVPPGHRLLGIDEDTALIRSNPAWVVRGRGRVHGALP